MAQALKEHCTNVLQMQDNEVPTRMPLLQLVKVCQQSLIKAHWLVQLDTVKITLQVREAQDLAGQ